MRTGSGRRFQRKLRWSIPFLGAQIGAVALFTVQAGASLAYLTPGHAYCYYFSSAGKSGGMHLVAANPHEIAAGPSNFISGTGGKPQDSVFYIDCVAGQGRVGGDAYVGVPRIVMQLNNGHYTFDRRYVTHGIRHLGIKSRATSTASVVISGTVNQGVINGSVHVSVPGCLPHALVIVYAGT